MSTDRCPRPSPRTRATAGPNRAASTVNAKASGKLSRYNRTRAPAAGLAVQASTTRAATRPESKTAPVENTWVNPAATLDSSNPGSRCRTGPRTSGLPSKAPRVPRGLPCPRTRAWALRQRWRDQHLVARVLQLNELIKRQQQPTPGPVGGPERRFGRHHGGGRFVPSSTTRRPHLRTSRDQHGQDANRPSQCGSVRLHDPRKNEGRGASSMR